VTEEGRAIRLQVALDIGPPERLLEIARQVAPYADWLEVGTPWIISEGLAAVRTVRAAFPGKFIVADLKVVDAGRHEAEMAFAAGADLVTVLGVASDVTIRQALAAAAEWRRLVMVDLLRVAAPVARARHLAALGVPLVGVHTGSDDSRAGADPLKTLDEVSRAVDVPLAVAGGIDPDGARRVASYHPYTVVVGSAITAAEDPKASARRIRAVLDGQAFRAE
jgi:3-hexulose-6-phosphate synthase